MRLVLDTNVVVSGLLWDGLPRQLLLHGISPNLRFFTSAPLLRELGDTLTRAKFERKIAASLFSVDQLVTFYTGLAAAVRPMEVPRIASDPDDDVVIGTALAARADFIVTGDRMLLSVMHYQEAKIVTVSTAIERIAQSLPGA